MANRKIVYFNSKLKIFFTFPEMFFYKAVWYRQFSGVNTILI